MFYQLSSYCKKHLLTDVQQNFLPETFVRFNDIICAEFGNLQTDASPKNCCKFNCRRPNLINYLPKLIDLMDSKKFKNFDWK